MDTCQDTYKTSFSSFAEMYAFHEAQERGSTWRRCKVKNLRMEPLDSSAPLHDDRSAFPAEVSAHAVEDTAEHLGLALCVDGEL